MAAQSAHAIDPSGALANVTRRNGVAVRLRRGAIRVENSRCASLQDGKLPVHQGLGVRECQKCPGHGIGAVRAAQDDNAPPLGASNDTRGFGEPLMSQ
jgi:hypothetical protein